jgi:metal-sulfur cluster biosynthetic enzyme
MSRRAQKDRVSGVRAAPPRLTPVARSRINVDERGQVIVRMTLTAPGCPAAGLILEQARTKIAPLWGVASVCVALVWDPPWTRDRMTEEAKIELGLS